MNGKKSHVHGLEELLLLRRQYYPKLPADSMQSLSKSQKLILQKWSNGSLNSYGIRRVLNAKAILNNRNKVGGLIHPNFKS